MARDVVRGDRELARALRALAKGPSAREVDTMANQAMAPVLQDVKNRLRAHRNFASKYPSFFPKQRGPFTNHLDKNVFMRKDGKQSQYQRSYRLGGTRRAARLMHLLEWGSRPHMQPNLGFMHPGSTPRPTMVPAFEHGKADVVRDFGYLTADWLQRRSAQLGMRFVRR